MVVLAGVETGFAGAGDVGVCGSSGMLLCTSRLFSCFSVGAFVADTGDGRLGRSTTGAADGFDGVIFAATAIDREGVPFSFAGVDSTVGAATGVSGAFFSAFGVSAAFVRAAAIFANGEMGSSTLGCIVSLGATFSADCVGGLVSGLASVDDALSTFVSDSFFAIAKFRTLLMTVSIGGAVAPGSS